MVPYVRKSFRKHWLDGVKYIEYNKLAEDVKKEISVDEYLKKFYIRDDSSIEWRGYQDFGDAYKYAIDKTVQELE